MKLLIVEDEPDLADSICAYFNGEGHISEQAQTLAAAVEKIDLFDYDCIIVDIMLPDGNGLDVIRTLKQNGSSAGIVIVSARQSIDDKIEGLNIGADDYLTKPFNLSELNARVKSVIRRRHFNGKKEFSFHEITIEPDNRIVRVNGTEVSLTRKEYDLISYFFMNKNRVLTKETIVEHLWGDLMGLSADSLDFIYTHIRNLRKKLMDCGAADYIQTIYGVGYKFTDQ